MKKLIISLISLGLMAAVYFGLKGYAAKSHYEIFETARAQLADIQEVVVQTGIIKPQVGASIKVGTRATGVVVGMYVKIGDRVNKGKLIAKIDDREIKKAVNQLEASLARQKNELEKVRAIYPKQIDEIKEDIVYKTAVFELTQMELNRQKELVKKGFTTQSDFDKADTEYRKALADLTKTKTSLERIQAELQSEININQSEIANIEASIAKETINLSYTSIYSPIDGIVSDITVQEGETAVTGLQVANLVTIIVPEKLEMWVYVDETDIGRIKKGMVVQYSVDTYPDKQFSGTIDRINLQPVIKEEVVYYLAIVTIIKEDALMLWPEMTTYARVIISTKNQVLAVDNTALKYENNAQVVYKVTKTGGLEQQAVQTGLTGENKTEILSGLKQGDEVATRFTNLNEKPNMK
ncbi:MAG TPA: efflux RND transporter periplasmic adaptor subunit [Thermodesulfovibrionia bacterium]|nr:efflux RND transporter periplasmic adaptor subunit [Thermodesulfovibrionia bacterium]